MIDPVEPELAGQVLLAVRDVLGGMLTVQSPLDLPGVVCGLVVSDETPGNSGSGMIALGREEAAALVGVLKAQLDSGAGL